MIPFTTLTALDWQPELHTYGEIVQDVADVDQAIRIILTTPRRSDPLRPDFGGGWLGLVDRPIDQAIPALIADAVTAVARWEPRAEVVRIDYRVAAPAQLVLTVIWRLRLTQETQTTEVTYALA